MRERATLPQSTHKAFVGESQGFTEAWSGDAVTPTHYRDGIIREVFKVYLISHLVGVGMDMDGVKDAADIPASRQGPRFLHNFSNLAPAIKRDVSQLIADALLSRPREPLSLLAVSQPPVNAMY